MRRFILFLLMLNALYSKADAQGYIWYNFAKASIGYNKKVTLVGAIQDSLVFRNGVVYSGASVWDYWPQRFVAQIDSNYNLKWCRVLRGVIGESEALEMDVVNDRYGNTYIGGPYRGRDWGYSLNLTSAVSISSFPYSETIFLAKYDSVGNLAWYRKNQWGSKTVKFNLGIDSQDNIYFSAIGIDSVSFGGDTLKLSDTSAFVVKFDTGGNNLWVKEIPGSKSVYDFQSDPVGNSFVVGNCSDTQYCGTDTLYVPGNNSYIAKCAPSGVPQWQKILKGSPYNVGCSVGVGPNGSPSFVGTFEDSIHFNSLPTLLAPASTVNMFVANYDSIGNERWGIRSWPFVDYYYALFFIGAHAHSVRVDGLNNIYVSGMPTAIPVNIDTTSISFTSGVSGGQTNLVIKFDSLHNIQCTFSLWNVTMPHISFDRDNYVYFVGRVPYGGSYILINGDTILATMYSTTSYFYIAKFDQSCNLIHTELIGSPIIPLEKVATVNELLFKVYPVPTTDLLTISEVAEKSQYRLINIAGTSQMQGSLDKGDNTISLGHLPPGMYYLQVISDDGGSKQVARIVKQ